MPRLLTTPRLVKSAEPPLELLRLETVLVTQDAAAPVATVTLNRPKARNALSATALQEIEQAFNFLRRCYDVRVIILRGAGASFSAGHDLRAAGNENKSGTLRESMDHQRQGERTITAIRDADAVTISRVQGHAIGGGFGLMIACDLRCVTADASLYLPELDLGNPVPWGLTPMLARDVGLPVAKEIVLTCDELSPARAAQLGLVNRVCADEAALDAAVEELAYGIAAKSAAAVTLAKSHFRSMSYTSAAGNINEYEANWLSIAAQNRSRL